MGGHFNADEIFEIAEQIERNGAKFYRQGAEYIKDSEGNKLMLYLAAMEDKHLKVFSQMRSEMLSQGEQIPTVDPAFDPEGQAGLYLRAVADGRIFDVRQEPSELLTGEETVADILYMAIEKEKDSVVFYTGMKEMVPENLGKSEIYDIIKEEMSHITYISEELYRIEK
jgi:rubrerythrin